jgi:cyclohexyl-isocyanide hydratase
MRWLYHALPRSQADALLADATAELRPASLAHEGFVHASYLPEAEASARLYVTDDPVALLIDPRRVPHRVEEAPTPRGPMPHVHGPVPRDAIVAALELDDLGERDQVVGTRFGFVAFEGMTLLDLVGVLDPVSRIASMGFDPESTCEVVSGTLGTSVWEGAGARLSVAKVRPNLGGYDVVILPGGPGAHSLVRDTAFLRWLEAYPENRLAASVCTGALLWAAAGRLKDKRATTHASALDDLRGLGAEVSDTPPRLVADAGTLTAGGVTAGLDLGLELARRFAGAEAAQKIARQMELPGGFGR